MCSSSSFFKFTENITKTMKLKTKHTNTHTYKQTLTHTLTHTHKQTLTHTHTHKPTKNVYTYVLWGHNPLFDAMKPLNDTNGPAVPSPPITCHIRIWIGTQSAHKDGPSAITHAHTQPRLPGRDQRSNT